MESLGTRLMRERERRNLTLEDVSRSTKIRIPYLIAIEHESYDQLPGGIIGKGFIRVYARELAMDDQQAIVEYLATINAKNSVFGSQEAPEPPIREYNKANLATRVSWVIFAGVLVVLALGFVLLGYYKRELQNRTEVIGALSTHITRQKKEGPRFRTRESRHSGIDATTASSGTTNASVPIPLPSSGNFYVRIQAHEDAWLSITVDGKRIMQDTLLAMAEKTVEGRNLIVIRAGNIGGLDLSFNGQNLPKLGEHDEAKTLKFGPNGLQHPAPPMYLPITAASVEQ